MMRLHTALDADLTRLQGCPTCGALPWGALGGLARKHGVSRQLVYTRWREVRLSRAERIRMAEIPGNGDETT